MCACTKNLYVLQSCLGSWKSCSFHVVQACSFYTRLTHSSKRIEEWEVIFCIDWCFGLIIPQEILGQFAMPNPMKGSTQFRLQTLEFKELILYCAAGLLATTNTRPFYRRMKQRGWQRRSKKWPGRVFSDRYSGRRYTEQLPSTTQRESWLRRMWLRLRAVPLNRAKQVLEVDRVIKGSVTTSPTC